MAFVGEHVPQEDWEFFNSLNIQFEHKHIIEDKYSTWVIYQDGEIIFTRVGWHGRDYGDTYILIWGKSRVYFYVKARTVVLDNGGQEYRWYIESIKAPISLKDKRDKSVHLIREIANINYDRRSPAIFVIANIAEPIFVEWE